MSFWDNVKKFAQPYADDDYDDYDEDMDEYEEEAVETAPRARRTSPFASAKAEAAEPAAPAAPAASTGFTGHVVSASHSGRQEVVLFRPVNFNDASKAADDLRSRKVVVVNLENVDKAMARRVVDFLSGCAYSIDGSVKKIAQSAYLFCPSHVGVNGDLESMQSEVESYV